MVPHLQHLSLDAIGTSRDLEMMVIALPSLQNLTLGDGWSLNGIARDIPNLDRLILRYPHPPKFIVHLEVLRALELGDLLLSKDGLLFAASFKRLEVLALPLNFVLRPVEFRQPMPLLRYLILQLRKEYFIP